MLFSVIPTYPLPKQNKNRAINTPNNARLNPPLSATYSNVLNKIR